VQIQTIVFVSDLGHSTPKVPMLAHEISKLGRINVFVICPSLSKFQRDRFLPNMSEDLEIIEIPNLKSTYKRYSGLPWFLTKSLSLLLKIKRSLRSRFSSKDDPISSSFKEVDSWVNGVEVILLENNLVGKNLLIISSSSPIVAHAAAAKISEKYQIPWVADYRDGWSTNHVTAIKNLDLALEIEGRMLLQAKGVTVSANQLIPDLKKIYSGPIEIVHNGYIELKASLQKFERQSPLKIFYVGQVYENYQDFAFFLMCLEVINKKENLVEMHFVGSSSISVKKHYASRRSKLPKYIKTIGEVDISKIGEKFEESDILLFFTWKEELTRTKEYSSTVIGSKIYDYLGAGKFVLAFGPNRDGAIDDLLVSTGTGLRTESLDELRKLIVNLYDGNFNFLNRNKLALEGYSFHSQAKKLIFFIESL
jgi:hypothetical protein